MPVAQTVSGLANSSAKSSFAGGHPKHTQPAPPGINSVAFSSHHEDLYMFMAFNVLCSVDEIELLPLAR